MDFTRLRKSFIAKGGIAGRMKAMLCLAMTFLLVVCLMPSVPALAVGASTADSAPELQAIGAGADLGGGIRSNGSEPRDIEALVDAMSMDDKVSQMIVPSMRTWGEGEAAPSVTDLSKVDGLAQALQRHRYGGVILYASNVSDAGQVARLTSDLQKNNASVSSIPYLMCVDGEGGVVTRLTTGTRMTGSMAIGATGENAEENAFKTGRVIGEEVAAVGCNVDFAPVIDVNSNPTNPVIGTRSFSDDAQRVADLGIKFAAGLSENGVIATYKHFPGHGDTGADSHLDVSAVTKTYDELKETELVPFEGAIADGADLIMTAHVTLPKIDDEVEFADGTRGYFPATMSKKALTGILREDMGYEGVVITDALEMDALYKAKLVEADADSLEERKASAEYGANLAAKVIEAGADILLLPTDMKNNAAVDYYDDYIALLVQKAESDSAFAERINESVTRILNMKQRHGVLDTDVSGDDVEQKVEEAKQVVGSEDHRSIESDIARQAVTMVKNESCALPLSGFEGNTVIFGRDSDHVKTIEYAIRQMQSEGLIDEKAYVVNLASGTKSGSPTSKTRITVGYYRDYPKGKSPVVHYTEEMRQAIAQADAVVAFSVNFALGALQPTSDQYQGMTQIISDAHKADASFVLLSSNLPYDAARYQDSDAIMCCYMSAGLGSDPADSTGKLVAYNANVVRALFSMFGTPPEGTLPVSVPSIEIAGDGTVSYSKTDTLYPRGFGITSYANPIAVHAALNLTYATTSQTVANPLKPSGAKGKVSYRKVRGDKRISINKESGAITIAKEMPVGSYDVAMIVEAAGDVGYDSTTIAGHITVKVGKAANTLSAKQASNLSTTYGKKASFKVAQAFKVTKNVSGGALSYAKVSGNKNIDVLENGTVTVKAGTPAMTYSVKARVSSAATQNYKAGSADVTLKVNVDKAANSLKVSPVKAKQTVRAGETTSFTAKDVFKVEKNTSKGTLTYKLATVGKKAKGYITVSKAGKLTVKKGLAKGTYAVKVKATSAATKNYKAASKNVKFKVKVA